MLTWLERASTLQIFWALVGSATGAWVLWRGQQVQYGAPLGTHADKLYQAAVQHVTYTARHWSRRSEFDADVPGAVAWRLCAEDVSEHGASRCHPEEVQTSDCMAIEAAVQMAATAAMTGLRWQSTEYYEMAGSALGRAKLGSHASSTPSRALMRLRLGTCMSAHA